MKVLASWLELRVNQYENGKYVVYEALGDRNVECDTWGEVVVVVNQILNDIESDLE